jgi:uncharacterized HAD superfamily protein
MEPTSNVRQDGQGKRFNDDKLRLDLCPTFAQEQYAKVLGAGAKKYGDANWRRGMKWSNVLASLERHLHAIKSGQDYDSETGLLHSAHVMCNAAFLTEYYHIYPQGDDRPHRYLSRPRIGLDIDGVLCDFVKHYNDHFKIETVPEVWNFDKNMATRMDVLKDNEDFWMTTPILTKPSDISFEPTCYITSRSIPQAWTEAWLEKNGFPNVPVYSVGYECSKVDVIKKLNIDIFVDDRFENFVELNNAGIFCYLFDQPHNQRYNVESRRLFTLKEL